MCWLGDWSEQWILNEVPQPCWETGFQEGPQRAHCKLFALCKWYPTVLKHRALTVNYMRTLGFLHKGLGVMHQSIRDCNSFYLSWGRDFFGYSKQWAVQGSTVAVWCSSPKANDPFLRVSVSPKPRTAWKPLGTSVSSWIVGTFP